MYLQLTESQVSSRLKTVVTEVLLLMSIVGGLPRKPAKALDPAVVRACVLGQQQQVHLGDCIVLRAIAGVSGILLDLVSGRLLDCMTGRCGVTTSRVRVVGECGNIAC